MTAKQAKKEAMRIAFDFEQEIELGYQADNWQTFAVYADYVYSMMSTPIQNCKKTPKKSCSIPAGSIQVYTALSTAHLSA